jgi:hypothetical protein
MLEMSAVDFKCYEIDGLWYEETYELIDSFFCSKKASLFRVHGYGRVLVKEFKEFRKILSPRHKVSQR